MLEILRVKPEYRAIEFSKSNVFDHKKLGNILKVPDNEKNGYE